MNFALNEQQEMLKKSTRDFLTAKYPEKVLQAMSRDDRGYTPEIWKQMAELGWTALGIPEEFDGIGDFIDLTVVMEEMGRACLISPFFASVILGASTIVAAGNQEQKEKYLPQIAAGTSIFTVALTEPSGRYTPEAVETSAVADGTDFIINGTKLFVPDAHNADYIICAARTAWPADLSHGITLFVVSSNTPGISIKLLKTISGDRQCEVAFSNVRAGATDCLGNLNEGWSCLEKVMERAAVARCTEMVGGAQQVLDIAVAYAKDRVAFDHPIGAYQAIQHRTADMLIDVDGSRYLTQQAAWRINDNLPAAAEVAAAKAFTSQAFQRVVNSAHQIHGAIGFTEDHVLHQYTKRARSHELSFGSPAFHLEKLATLL